MQGEETLPPVQFLIDSDSRGTLTRIVFSISSNFESRKTFVCHWTLYRIQRFFTQHFDFY